MALISLAVVAPMLFVVWLRRRPGRTWRRSLAQLLAIVVCQSFAVTTLFVWVDDQCGFYTAWSDLIGRGGGPAIIKANGLGSPGQGQVQTLTVAGSPGTNGPHEVLVWLPPQYGQPQVRTTRFPVVMILPGQPSTPEAMFVHYKFGAVASATVTSGQAARSSRSSPR